MLAVVLAGIGLGALVAAMLHRRDHEPGKLLRVLLFLAAIVTLLAYLFFGRFRAAKRGRVLSR